MITTKLDLSGLNALAKRLTNLTRLEARTGFFEEDKYDDGTPVAQVAAWNEYGTRYHPQRPFMDETIRDSRKKLVAALKLVAQSSIKGDGASRRLMRAVGGLVAEQMKLTIANYPGSNSESTIARKGFNRPLFESGKMLESVKFKIGNGAGFK